MVSMAFKIENSNVFVKFQNHLKIDIQAFNDLHNKPCKFGFNWTSRF